jgi:hypothetical protein
MSALVKGRRDWPAVLSLGFSIDRNGKRRKPVWINIVTLGILLPGFAMWGLYRVFTTPTGVGLWGLAVVMYLFTMFGVTLGNHRYWTHRGFEARFPLQVVLAVASCACRKPRPGHATRRYSLIRLPTRVCLRMRYWSRSTGSGSGFSGAAARKDR